MTAAPAEHAPEPKLVIVDTNCIVRIYFSPLRPILGATVAGYIFRTIGNVAGELKGLAGRDDLAWLKDPVIQAEVEEAVITLTKQQRRAIEQDTQGIRVYGDGQLHLYCEKQKIGDRFLSHCDAKLLAAALEMKAALATDEWPLRHVADEYDDDNGDPIELLSTVELLSLLERDGRLSREDRVATYATWVRDGTKLLRDSDILYAKLFGEPAPDGQG
jgi:hypothetical protein